MRTLLVLGSVSILVLALATISTATVRNVPSGPYPTIQAGISACIPGDTVLVAKGTYTGPLNRDLDFGGTNIVLLSAEGPDSTIIDCQELGRGIIFQTGEGTAAVVDGFTFTRGDSTLDGSAILILAGTSPTFNNCTISDNKSGAPIGPRNVIQIEGNPTFTNCTITNNVAESTVSPAAVVYILGGATFTDCSITNNSGSGAGGTILCVPSASTTFSGCEISGNTGGFNVLLGLGSNPSVFTDCTIVGNSTNFEGGGVIVNGSHTLTNCTITGNSADASGGGVFVDSGSPTLTNCTITGNSADASGGGVFVNDGSSPTFTDCSIIGNSSVDDGGGVSMWQFEVLGISPSFTGCTISGNSATRGGGVMIGDGSSSFTDCTVTGNIASLVGGAFYIEAGFFGSSPTLTGCTIAGNTSGGDGGGIAAVGSALLAVSTSLSSAQTVIWGNCAAGLGDQAFVNDATGTADISFTCSDVDTSGVAGGGTVTYVSNNIFTDPLFCAPVSCNNAPTTAGDYALAANSPCIPADSPCSLLIGAVGVGCSFGEGISITDVGNDQGRRVRVRWVRDSNDVTGAPTPVAQYSLWREVVPGLVSPAPLTLPPPGLLAPPGDWDFVETVPALGYPTYSTVVPTLCDSTVSAGICWSTFYIVAHTSTPTVFFQSAPDSGYSVDNLAPWAPMGFTVAYNTGAGNHLTWDPSEDEDFKYYNIYRAAGPFATPNGPPGAGDWELIHATIDLEWYDDPQYDGWNIWYKMTTVDLAGNESDQVVWGDDPGEVVGIGDIVTPDQFALYQNVPNPFNPTTVIRYDVPAGGGSVSLKIFDAAGRLVRTLINGEQTSGQKTATWDGRDDHGQMVASGVYFYRMRAEGFSKSQKVVFLK
ncbi:MAG: T9SS type A sorting domain-containing protein [Candidatus Krumholzibacteria bacterium]|nr:T9SS type A sorting domain-containing protein [Candidatus Krumholzibacteria bacterium]